jgi:hypothetical protein
MRTKPNLSFAAVRSRPPLKLSKNDWQRIETAYGHSIAAPVRRRIAVATREYLDWAEFEQNAETRAESTERVYAVKKAARAFRQTIFVCPPNIGRQADYHARWLISAHMGLTFEGRNGLQNLALKLERDISRGCEQALAELKRRKDSGFRHGETWELWVRKLITILSKDKLPTQVRKDTDKTRAAKPSAFVSFVRELQACLPEQYRRSHALRPDFEANIALSTAIVRSRSSHRVTKSPPSTAK